MQEVRLSVGAAVANVGGDHVGGAFNAVAVCKETPFDVEVLGRQAGLVTKVLAMDEALKLNDMRKEIVREVTALTSKMGSVVGLCQHRGGRDRCEGEGTLQLQALGDARRAKAEGTHGRHGKRLV